MNNYYSLSVIQQKNNTPLQHIFVHKKYYSTNLKPYLSTAPGLLKDFFNWSKDAVPIKVEPSLRSLRPVMVS